MLAHLDYRPAVGGAHDVSTCTMVPSYIRVLFEECKGVVPEHVGIANEDPEMEDNAPVEPILSQSIDNEMLPLFTSQSTDRSDPTPQDMRPRELRQLNITEGFNTSTKQHLDRVWETAFYEANLLFNIVRHLAFVYAVRETARHRMPAYTPPSYNAIRSKLLTARKIDLDKELKEKTGNSIKHHIH